MADIFIAYSQKDGAQVAPIARALEAEGWSVWWDPHGAAGETLETMVERELREASCVVVVWSSSSVESDWVLGEADEGRERRILVPIVVDEQRPPIRFRRFKTVSLADWDGKRDGAAYSTLVGGVRRILGEPSVVSTGEPHTEREASVGSKSSTANEGAAPEGKAGAPVKDGGHDDAVEPITTRSPTPTAPRRAISWKALALMVVVLAGVATVSYLAYERRQASVAQAELEVRRATEEEARLIVAQEREQRVDRLMSDAEKAFGDDRWTTPPGNNAFVLYSEVLTLEPRHEDATRGLERIVDRYIESARARMEQQSWRDARVNLDRAEQVGVLPERIASAGSELERRLAEVEARRTPGTTFRDTLRDGMQGPEMVVLAGGTFTMGSPPSELERDADEGPQRKVTIGPFAIGRHEVTFADYDAFARAAGQGLPDDEGWGRGARPVINVSWDDANAYAAWLSEQTGAKYRLPSEAEWEYAARAGTTGPFWTGKCITTEQANFDVDYGYADCGANRGEPRRKTVPVASLPANAWGLYEVVGNVWEWVEDCWHKNYEGAPEDGSAWLEGNSGECGRRVIRGGSWYNNPGYLRSSYRYGYTPVNRDYDLGFRLAQDL